MAALQDEDFVQKTYALNLVGMQQVTQGLTKLGLEFIPSYGNFVCFRVTNAAGGECNGADGVYRRLLELGVIVRPIASYDMPEYLRVSIGLKSENEKFLSALRQTLGEVI